MSRYFDSDSSSPDRGYAKPKKSYYDDYDDEDGYYQQKKPQNEKEALRVMERAKDKKFWNCDDVDNFNSLRGAIELLFNEPIPGNVYAVKYQENQNGTRLTIVCETCDKTLSSYDPFMSHENGKNHKKARQQKLTVPDPNISKQPKNRRINTPKDIFFEDTLEEMIDHSKRTTIGVHFIYKEVIDGTERFTCTLCTRTCNCEKLRKEKMYSHITNKDHMRNYLEVKHGFKKVSSLEEEAKHIEELEGKIHHKITDFSNQLEVDEKYSKRLIKKREKSSSSSSSSSDSSRSSSTSRRRKVKSSPSRRRYSPSPSRSIKRSPNSRSYSPFPSRSIKRSPGSRRSRYSPSPPRSIKRSPSSRRSPSPSRSYRSRRSRSHSPVSSKARSPARVRTPPQKRLADASVSVDHYNLEGQTIPNLCKNLSDDNIKDEYLNVISEKLDMQNLIIHALYVYNSKVEEYYKENGEMFNDGERVGPLAEKSEDIHNMICQLTALSRDAEE